MAILVTGAAGFIGSHVVRYLLSKGDDVVGLDNLNDYYSVDLKRARLADLGISIPVPFGDKKPDPTGQFSFVQADIIDASTLSDVFESRDITHVCHLAAQVGVRYSLEAPHEYVSNNVVGFLNVLEACRLSGVQHLVYASSSSVYGLNDQMPYRTSVAADTPVSMYAATKKSNELMAHVYAHTYQLPVTGLRFFTVYGPWGRPDMSYFLFADAMMKGTPINVYNNGQMARDFTFVNDTAEAVVRVIKRPPSTETGDETMQNAALTPFRLYNVASSKPVPLMEFIHELERALGQKAVLHLQPMQPGDVVETWADVQPFKQAFGFQPATPLREGLSRFAEWYLSYRKHSG